MRRPNVVSVRVKAPSRGLVTRWPEEMADGMATGVEKFSLPGMRNRASTVASNVRYDNGVVRNAPGYDRVILNNPLLDGLLAHWRLDEADGATRADSSLNQYDLIDSLGDGQTVDVLQTEGLIDGAALFTEQEVIS